MPRLLWRSNKSRAAVSTVVPRRAAMALSMDHSTMDISSVTLPLTWLLRTGGTDLTHLTQPELSEFSRLMAGRLFCFLAFICQFGESGKQKARRLEAFRDGSVLTGSLPKDLRQTRLRSENMNS